MSTPVTSDMKKRRNRRKIELDKEWLEDPCPHCDKPYMDYAVAKENNPLLDGRNRDVLAKFIPTLFRFKGNVTLALKETADDIPYTSIETVRKAVFPWVLAHDSRPKLKKDPPVAAVPISSKASESDLNAYVAIAARLELVVGELNDAVAETRQLSMKNAEAIRERSSGNEDALNEVKAELVQLRTLANQNASKASNLSSRLNTHQHDDA